MRCREKLRHNTSCFKEERREAVKGGRRKERPGLERKEAEENILLLTDSVMELMGFCHFLSSQCLLNRGLCIQKDH